MFESKGVKKGVFVLAVIAFIAFLIFGIPKTPTDPNKLTLDDWTQNSSTNIDVKVHTNANQFQITNSGPSNLTYCQFVINNNYYYPAKTSDWAIGDLVDQISARETASVGMELFALRDGTRFNSYSTAIQQFTVHCKQGASNFTF